MAVIITVMIPMSVWKDYSHWVLMLAVGLLIVVLLPGVGVRVNGSQRWLNLGLFNFQVSEFAKLAMLTFMASYLVRQGDELRTTWAGFGKPMVILGAVLILLLLEPDFGSAVVLSGTILAVLFLAGIPLWRFVLTLGVLVLLLAYLATSSDYRMQRILSFMDPWADQFNSGYQLTQALIAFGRGEWFGVGLGNSLQKLFYLPEAHTDFVFAVIAEETGLVGAVLLIVLLWTLGERILRIGRRCIVEGQGNDVMRYAGYLVSGVGLLFLFQCFINIGVSCGLLPTKGLTLPFISYGGSSVLVWSALLALVLRADWERRQLGEREADK
jgi:cell division protein FtsW